MARETKILLLPDDASHAQCRQEILRCAAEVRRLGGGQQAARLERAVKLLQPPRLAGVLRQLQHPSVWPTKDHALWLAERLVVAGRLIADLLKDAEITGSTDTIERARAWIESLGFDELDA